MDVKSDGKIFRQAMEGKYFDKQLNQGVIRRALNEKWKLISGKKFDY